jgi:hypothetical protein
MQVFQEEEEVQWNVLRMWGLWRRRRRRGDYLRKEPVPYCVNYKESVP